MALQGAHAVHGMTGDERLAYAALRSSHKILRYVAQDVVDAQREVLPSNPTPRQRHAKRMRVLKAVKRLERLLEKQEDKS